MGTRVVRSEEPESRDLDGTQQRTTVRIADEGALAGGFSEAGRPDDLGPAVAADGQQEQFRTRRRASVRSYGHWERDDI